MRENNSRLKRRIHGAALLLGISLSACQFFGPNTTEQTLLAENQRLSTEIAAVRATATVEADRMLVTLEHAQTTVSDVSGQTQDLSATLIARGTPAVDISQLTPQAPITIAAPPPILDIGPNPALGVTPISITPGSVSDPNNTAAQNDAILVITPIAASNSPLTNLVTAEGVRDDDCALASVSTFTTDTTEIYVVATAAGIGPDDIVVSRWFHEGQEVIFYDWSPTFDIEQACIWFYIDQSEVAFTPGNWRVQMELNQQVVGVPVSFSILETSAAGDAALEEAMGS